MDQNHEPVAALELYSGIGGFHYALEGFKHATVRAAIDINTTANETYAFNFPHINLYQRNIQSFTMQEIDALNINMLWMSPPCQPFTRLGKQRDCDDKRTDSFLHIIDVIPKLKKRPPYILLENVKGFETSQACSSIKQMLKMANYDYQEFLLTPPQFGIPNSRLRYYIVAKLRPHHRFGFQTSSEIMSTLPACESSHTAANIAPSDSRCCLKPYLEDLPNECIEAYCLPDKVLLKFAKILDIVSSDSNLSCCFTKGYSHYVEGTGSVLHENRHVQIADVYRAIETADDNEKLHLLKTLKLRYFTPREVANLMGFPPQFNFPKHFTARQKYRLLGNSLNVTVVQELLKLCFNN